MTADDERNPLLSPTAGMSDKKRFVWRHYLLDCIVFLFCAAHSVGDLASYQYVYSFLARELNFTSKWNMTSSGCEFNKTDPLFELQQKVATMAAMWQLYFGLACGIPGIFACIIFGTYSDKVGRRLMMVVSMAGIGGRSLMYVLACHWELPISYLFIGYAIEGVSGSLPTMTLGFMAYSADISEVGKARTVRLVLINAVGGIAVGVAYLVSACAIPDLGYEYTFAIVVGAFFLNCLLVFCLPESRQGHGMGDLTFRQYIYRTVQFFVEGSRTNPNRCFYILCTGAFILAITINNCIYGTETLFVLNSPLCWNAMKIGYYGAIKQFVQRVTGVCSIVAFLRFCGENTVIIIIGLFYISSLTLEAFSTTDMFMYIVAGLGIGMPSFSTLIRGVLSVNTDKDHQGALFASSQLFSSLFTSVGTILLSAMYEWTVERMPGAVFLLMAGMILLSVILMISVRILMIRSPDTPLHPVNY